MLGRQGMSSRKRPSSSARSSATRPRDLARISQLLTTSQIVLNMSRTSVGCNEFGQVEIGRVLLVRFLEQRHCRGEEPARAALTVEALNQEGVVAAADAFESRRWYGNPAFARQVVRQLFSHSATSTSSSAAGNLAIQRLSCGPARFALGRAPPSEAPGATRTLSHCCNNGRSSSFLRLSSKATCCSAPNWVMGGAASISFAKKTAISPRILGKELACGQFESGVELESYRVPEPSRFIGKAH